MLAFLQTGKCPIAEKVMREELHELLNRSVAEVPGFTRYTVNCFLRNHARKLGALKYDDRSSVRRPSTKYLGDIVQISPQELYLMRSVGKMTVQNVVETLDGLGLQLGMDIEGWCPPDDCGK